MTGKREENHADRVKYKVLTAAKKLFVRQGYKKTTIRQIVEESGVLTGSIYYLYKNKADIFQALVLSLLRGCVELIDEQYREESPAFKMAAMFMVELKCVEASQTCACTGPRPIMAVAMMVREPPCSMFRAAPKKRFGLCREFASIPPVRIFPE